MLYVKNLAVALNYCRDRYERDSGWNGSAYHHRNKYMERLVAVADDIIMDDKIDHLGRDLNDSPVYEGRFDAEPEIVVGKNRGDLVRTRRIGDYFIHEDEAPGSGVDITITNVVTGEVFEYYRLWDVLPVLRKYIPLMQADLDVINQDGGSLDVCRMLRYFADLKEQEEEMDVPLSVGVDAFYKAEKMKSAINNTLRYPEFMARESLSVGEQVIEAKRRETREYFRCLELSDEDRRRLDEAKALFKKHFSDSDGDMS